MSKIVSTQLEQVVKGIHDAITAYKQSSLEQFILPTPALKKRGGVSYYPIYRLRYIPPAYWHPSIKLNQVEFGNLRTTWAKNFVYLLKYPQKVVSTLIYETSKDQPRFELAISSARNILTEDEAKALSVDLADLGKKTRASAENIASLLVKEGELYSEQIRRLDAKWDQDHMKARKGGSEYLAEKNSIELPYLKKRDAFNESARSKAIQAYVLANCAVLVAQTKRSIQRVELHPPTEVSLPISSTLVEELGPNGASELRELLGRYTQACIFKYGRIVSDMYCAFTDVPFVKSDGTIDFTPDYLIRLKASKERPNHTLFHILKFYLRIKKLKSKTGSKWHPLRNLLPKNPNRKYFLKSDPMENPNNPLEGVGDSDSADSTDNQYEYLRIGSRNPEDDLDEILVKEDHSGSSQIKSEENSESSSESSNAKRKKIMKEKRSQSARERWTPPKDEVDQSKSPTTSKKDSAGSHEVEKTDKPPTDISTQEKVESVKDEIHPPLKSSISYADAVKGKGQTSDSLENNNNNLVIIGDSNKDLGDDPSVIPILSLAGKWLLAVRPSSRRPTGQSFLTDGYNLYPIRDEEIKEFYFELVSTTDNHICSGIEDFTEGINRKIESTPNKSSDNTSNASVSPSKKKGKKKAKSSGSNQRITDQDSQFDSNIPSIYDARPTGETRRAFYRMPEDVEQELLEKVPEKYYSINSKSGEHRLKPIVYKLYALYGREELENMVKTLPFDQVVRTATDEYNKRSRAVEKPSFTHIWSDIKKKYKGTSLVSNPSSKREKEFLNEYNLLKKQIISAGGPVSILPKLKRKSGGGTNSVSGGRSRKRQIAPTTLVSPEFLGMLTMMKQLKSFF